VKTVMCLALMWLSAFAVGCGSDGTESGEESPTPSTVGSTTVKEAPTLVGRWERVNECPQLVKAFEQAGLGDIAAGYLGDYFPDTTPKELARKDDLCEGADPIVHSHFFTDTGAFGSLTEDLEQVDDGMYETTDDRTFVISKEFPDMTFHYRIEGDNLFLTPVLTQTLKRQAESHPLDFTAAGWAITMSYPGHAWKRVDCAGWC